MREIYCAGELLHQLLAQEHEAKAELGGYLTVGITVGKEDRLILIHIVQQESVLHGTDPFLEGLRGGGEYLAHDLAAEPDSH